jgi:hypothetical protein
MRRKPSREHVLLRPYTTPHENGPITTRSNNK